MAKQNIFGLILDTKTGKVTLEDGTAPTFGAGFTFEPQEGRNPLQYATEKTAKEIAASLSELFPKVTFVAFLDEDQDPPKQMIKATSFGISELFCAGLVANAAIRRGDFSFIKDELKTAGLLF